MTSRFRTNRLRYALQQNARSTCSPAVTIRKCHINVDPDHNFVSCGEPYSHHNGKSPNQVAFKTLSQLLRSGCFPSPYFLNEVISFCAKSSAFDMGIQLHPIVVKLGFHSNVYICSALVDMYGKFGEVSNAQLLFDEMPYRNAVTWNSIISSYLHFNYPRFSVDLFLDMLKGGISPSPFTVSTVLVACSQLEMGELGIQLHGLSLKAGFRDNIVVGTGLIDMYSKSGNVIFSRRVFDHMPQRNFITWTCMVTAYAQNQQPNEAMIIFKQMLYLGYWSNSVAYNSLLCSFSSPDDYNHCTQIHCRVIREGLGSNPYISVSLVTAYSKCGGNITDFQKASANIKNWDQISWNSIIAGLSNLECGEETLKLFSEMRQAGIDLDHFTLSSILKAVGVISALEEGKQIHALIFKTSHGVNVCVQNGLVSMYSRCGAINDAKKVFLSMQEHDIVSWNSLLSGCAHHGYGKEAVELFRQMHASGLKPDRTTFLSYLTACSHAGLLDEALECFKLMRSENMLDTLKREHYASFVDLLGRAGNLHEAEDLINKMPLEPGPSVYKALLSACSVHGNKVIALRAAEKLLQLYPNDPATYIMLANLLATGGYWDDAAEIRKLMIEKGVIKRPGYSWI